jgi:hypothetical protein
MTTSKLFLVLLAGLSVAAFASPASAQAQQPVTEQRAAAIQRCIAVARSQYQGVEQDTQRAEAYKACMVAAGERP